MHLSSKHKCRLRKLAHYLIDYKGPVELKKAPPEMGKKICFGYSRVLEKAKCGSSGCAVGFLPIVFPRDFYYVRDNLFHASFESRNEGSIKFLGLTLREYMYLFNPHKNGIRANAHAKTVGRHILKFLNQYSHYHTILNGDNNDK